MLVYTSYDALNVRVTYEKHSALMGEVSGHAAFSYDDTLTLRVCVPRLLCASSAVLKLYRDEDMSTRDILAELCEFSDADDIFSVSLKLSELCIGESGLFYYTFGLDTPYGMLYTARDGSVTPDRAGVSNLQLSVYRKDFDTPSAFSGGMMYQIFVDRFFDGGRPILPSDSTKIYNSDWTNGVPQYAVCPGGDVANNEFFGGNLWGVAEKLDYIRSLGADIIYLCPIFEAASNHKYDTGDYEAVDAMFGGNEALEHLISECKVRGMKLILDGVFNHTGADSRYFNKYGRYPDTGAYQSQNSPFFDWYTFREYPDDYRCWWGVKILPAVNSRNSSWRSFICQDVIRHYLKKGIDGWRLDVADELADEFLDDLRISVKDENPDAIIIGEVWEDASNKVSYDHRRRYFGGSQLDSVMNYPLGEAVIDFVKTGNCTRLCTTARELWAHYPACVTNVLMNFLGTHDTERILTVLADAGTPDMTNAELSEFRLTESQRTSAKHRLMCAWALLASFPGIPCIYYGDEAGMEGGRDPFNRMPYVWGREDHELLAFYRKIGQIRRSEPIFARGSSRIAETGNPGQFLLIRSDDKNMICAAVNLSKEPWELEFERNVYALIENAPYDRIFTLMPGQIEYLKL